MTKDDFKQFGALMLTIGEMSVGSEKDKKPSKEKIYLYFCALADMSIDQIKKNVLLHFTRSDWFPGIASIRNPIPLKDQAILDYDIVRSANDHASRFGNGEYSGQLKKYLSEKGRADLYPVAMKFANEFSNTQSSILRSQFSRYYQAFYRTQELKMIEDRSQKFLELKS